MPDQPGFRKFIVFCRLTAYIGGNMSKHKMTGEISARIAEATGLPVDVLGAAPIFQMLSDREMIVEGVRNLDYYDDSSARIHTGKIGIVISGKRLYIKCLANQNICVSGKIEKIELIRTE